MRLQTKDYILPLLKTMGILLLFNIMMTVFMPFFGSYKFIIPLNVFIILFLGFKIEGWFLPLFILIIQYGHSIFSVEGWEAGTIVGIIICLIISYVRDFIHFGDSKTTIITVQVFQTFWFLLISILQYIKGSETEFLVRSFWYFLPESIIISLFSPLLFVFFDHLWKTKEKEAIEEKE